MIMIGSDPEFTIKKGNSFISAYDIIKGGTSAKFGTDGNSSTGEIRPEASDSPEGHFKNIESLLKENLSKMSDIYKIDLTNDYQTIGGHLHISGVDQAKIRKLVKNLDNFLGLPFMLIEPKEVFNRHLGGGYGVLGDYRTEGCSNGTKVEYRTLPSWLSDPKLTKMTLAVAYVIADETQNGKLDSDLLPTFFQSTAILETLEQPNAWINMENICKQTEQLKTFKLYPKYKEDIDMFVDMVKNHQKFDLDFQKNWKIQMLKTVQLNEEYYKKVMAKKFFIGKTDTFLDNRFISITGDLNLARISNCIGKILDQVENNLSRYQLCGLAEARGQKWLTNNYEVTYKLHQLGVPVRITPLENNYVSQVDNSSFRDNYRGGGGSYKIWIPFKDRAEENLASTAKILFNLIYKLETEPRVSYSNCQEVFDKLLFSDLQDKNNVETRAEIVQNYQAKSNGYTDYLVAGLDNIYRSALSGTRYTQDELRYMAESMPEYFENMFPNIDPNIIN